MQTLLHRHFEVERGLARALTLIVLFFVGGSAWAQPTSFTDPAGYPAPWPSTWQVYTYTGSPASDATGGSGGDSSNGGTNPSGAVDIVGTPAEEFYGDGSNFFMRYTLAGSPLALTGTSQPYGSATWTVLFDVTGDGYKDFALMLSGIDSSGAGNNQPDDLIVMYNKQQTQAINPATDTIWRQDSALNPTNSSGAGSDGEPLESANWDKNPDPYVWDFSRTRVVQLDRTLAPGSNNSRYYLDLQVPLSALNATALGGPKLTASSAVSLAYATANSNTNPAQKDFGYPGDFAFTDPSQTLPFGDSTSLGGGTTIQRPAISAVTAGTCSSSVPLSATVTDSLEAWGTNQLRSTVRKVEFFYYADQNGNGLADDAQSWVSAATVQMTATATSTSVSGGTVANNIGPWATTWNATGVLRGQYLIKALATDNQGNITDSLDSSASSTTYNPATGGTSPVYATLVNSCGATPPSLVKSASAAQVAAGGTVDFTLTVTNTLSAPLSVSALNDLLPAGFSYQSTLSSSLGTPTTSPAANATGSISWTFSPSVSVPANSSRTLVFRAKAPTTIGTYNNGATATTSFGVLTSAPVEVAVGAPRLTLAKSSSVTSAAPGSSYSYTITYANDASVSATNTVISDVLPAGISFVSASNGGSYNSSNRTVTWNVGTLPSGEGPFSVTLSVSVDDPYPASAPLNLVNTATITSSQTSPASAAATTLITAPRPNLVLQKSANVGTVAPGGQVSFVLRYANTGNSAATNVVLSDVVPAGFTFVSASGGGTLAGSTVTWNVGSVAAGASGSVTVTLQASSPYANTNANPQTNTASLVSDQTAAVTASDQVGVQLASTSACTSYYYRSSTANVGSAGTQQVATTGAPTSATTTSTTPTVTVVNSWAEIGRFYQDPVAAKDQVISGNMTGTLYVTKTGSPQASFDVLAYAYDPATGNTVLLNNGAYTYGIATGNKTNQPISYTIPVSGILPAGYRLLFVVMARTENVNNSNSISLNYGSSNSPSNSNVCTSLLPVSFSKKVDKLTAQVGDTLTYTINFGNGSTIALTGAQIVDTLPTGVTFQSASLNGAPITPTLSGQTLTFNVSTVGATSGTLAAGGSGTLSVVVTVNQPLPANISTLLNSATLNTTRLAPFTSSASTTLRRPNVSISKSASNTLLIPGDTVTFSLSVVNSGDAPASNVVMSDVLPATAYFSYVTGSTKLNGAVVTPTLAGNTLSYTLPTLAAGASATLSFDMKVAASGVPVGITTLDNTATVGDSQTTATRPSNTVTVSISSNPNLRLSKSVSPTQTTPAGVLVYTLTLKNEGASAATDVLLSDPLPANTSYVNASMKYNGAAQTDTADTDVGVFDAANNRTQWRISTLAPGATVTASFSVRVDPVLPAGDSVIANTATVAASNAATKTASVSATATAAPKFALTKSAPQQLPYPVATLTQAASGVALTVDATAGFSVGDYVSVAGTVAKVVSVSGSTVTLNTAVTAAAGTQILPVWDYVLSYGNTGDAAASNVVLRDVLPPGVVYLSSSPAASSAPAVGAGGTVIWNIASVAAGSSASVTVRVSANASGDYLNSASVSSTQTPQLTSNTTTTQLGILTVKKQTSTPSVTTTTTGGAATYSVTVTNSRLNSATGVVIQDILPVGFSYDRTISVTGGTCGAFPAASSAAPTWSSCTVPPGTTLTLTFAVNIAASVPSGTYNNDVEVSSSNIGVLPFDANKTTQEDVSVTRVYPDLTLTKSHTNDFTVGAPGLYIFKVDNTGPSATLGTITLTDTLPAGLTVNAGAAGNVVTSGTNSAAWTCSSAALDTATQRQTLSCSSPAVIAASDSSTFSFSVDVGLNTAVGSNAVTNNATVAGGGESNTSNNSANYNPVTGTSGDPTTILTPDLKVSKTHAPSTFVRGSTGSYTVTLENKGTAPTSGVITIKDTLPAGLSYGGSISGSDIGNWTCAVDTVNPRIGTCTSTSTISIPVNGSVTFTVPVNVSLTTANPVTNVVTVAGGNEATVKDTTTQGDNKYSDETPTIAPSDLTLEKSHTGSFTVGSTGTYSLTVNNIGPSATSGIITITDTLPAGLTYLGNVTNSDWSCSASDQIVTCTSAAAAAAIPPGGSSTLAFDVRVGRGVALPSVTNSATVSGGGESPSTNNGASDATTILSPNLSIDKSHTGSFVRGSQGTYTFTVTNTGTAPTNGTVTMTDTLPLGMTKVVGSITGANASDWTCVRVGTAPQALTCTSSAAISNVAPNNTSTFSFKVDVAGNTAASVTNTANIAAQNEATSLTNNNSDDDPTTTVGSPDLVISKTHDQAFLHGLTGTYTLSVTNNSATATAATSGTITVVDTLPAGLKVNNGTAGSVTAGGTNGANWTCSSDAGSPQKITCTSSSTLAIGASSTFTLGVFVEPSAAASVTNNVAVSGGGELINTTNNTDSDETSTQNGPNLTLNKSHTGNFAIGSSGTYSFEVQNVGAFNTFGQITVSDTLPVGMTVNGGAAGSVTVGGTNGSAWTCSGDALTTTDPKTQTITCTSTAVVAPAGSSIFSVAVDVGTNIAVPSVTNSAGVSGGGDVNSTNNNDDDPTTILYVDLNVKKTHTPSPFVRGKTGTYTIEVTNNGTLPSTGITTIEDTLPAGLTFVTGSVTNLDGGGWSCTAVAQEVTCTTSNVISHDANANPDNVTSFSFDVEVATSAASSVTNHVVVYDTQEAGQTDSDNSDDDVTPIVSPPDLSMTKSHVGNFTVGQTGTYTLKVSNTGGIATSGTITITDVLPTGLTYAGNVTGTGWSCSAVGQEVTCTTSNVIAKDGSSTLTFDVNVTTSAPAGVNTVSNTASVVGGGDSTSSGSNTDLATVLSPGLSIAKEHEGNFVRGETGEYTLTVTNGGTAATSGTITVTDTLPAGLSVNGGGVGAVAVSGTNAANWTCSSDAGTPQKISCTSSTVIATGSLSTFSFVIDVSLDASSSVTNQVAVSGGNEATNQQGNNTSTDPTTTVAPANLTIDKSHEEDFTVGNTGTYSLTVTNDGGSPTTGTVTVTDTLPAGLSVNDGAAGAVTVGGNNAASWSCESDAASPQVITCTSTTAISNVSPNNFSSFTLGVDVSLDAPLPNVTNVATVSGGGDLTPPADASSDLTTILSPDLVIEKSHVGSFVRGAQGTYTLVVTNAGDAATSETITVIDTLPAGLSVNDGGAGSVAASGYDGASWSCTSNAGSPQEITCMRTTPLSSLAGNNTSTFTLAVDVATDAGASISNEVSVAGGNEAPSHNGNNTASDPTTTVTPPDLKLAKSHTGSFTIGQSGTYTLSVTNDGGAATSDITAITLVDTLPSGMSVNGGAAGMLSVSNQTGGSWTCEAAALDDLTNTQEVTCTTNSVLAAAGGGSSFDLTVDLADDLTPGTLTNTATVSGGGDLTPADASDDTTLVFYNIDLKITKLASSVSPRPGDEVTYTIKVENLGSKRATNVVVTDALPAGVTLVSTSGCSNDPNGVPSCSLGTIAANSSKTFTLKVDVAEDIALGTLITNTATVSADQADNDASDDASSATVTVGSMVLAKRVCNYTLTGCTTEADWQESVTAKPGQLLEYRIQYTNIGLPVFDITISDTVPEHTEFYPNAYPGQTDVEAVCPDTTTQYLGIGATPQTTGVSVSLDTTCVLDTATRADGTEGEALLSGQSGSITFRVKIP